MSKFPVVSDKSTFKEITIPDLEQELLSFSQSGWSSQEEQIMDRYYNRVPLPALMKHLQNKTKNAIHCKASEMGITGRRDPINK